MKKAIMLALLITGCTPKTVSLHTPKGESVEVSREEFYSSLMKANNILASKMIEFEKKLQEMEKQKVIVK